ncbi:mutator-like element [Colletotrichum musicola]|uniref:Mutator-like element n=1 Tax=Colletotrichum musicola TaxID=2175873 RepID=A0A8H6ND70_9PEZI|nr:mutator-like element [Colletotrichum musicola]
MIIIEALQKGKWLLRYHPKSEHSQHNHGPTLDASAHLSHRRLDESTKTAIETTSRRVGIWARDVRAVVQEQFPDSNFTQRDIYNARALINREKLDRYLLSTVLIKLFNKRRVPYIVKWDKDDSNRLVGLVWTFPYCLWIWKRFPEVINFNNIYNTNRFKLLLF